MKLTVEELVKATNAELIKAEDLLSEFSISTDSRTVKKGQIYLPLKGEKFDGAQYIASSLERGASGYFTSDPSLCHEEATCIFLVEDTKIAYLQIARFIRRKYNPITIAITGSSGKTTTKEMMASVASVAFKTHKSILNHNNEIGLCQTILSMPKDTNVLIVEMGMRGLGEIELLSKYAEPDISIIANVGSAHVGRLGSLNNIALAKCEITSHQHKEGTLFAHDDKLIKKNNKYEGETSYFSLDDSALKILELNSTNSVFEYKNQIYKLNIEGEHNIQNALPVINAGLKLGIKPEDITKGLAEFKQIEKRWEMENISGYNVLNDSYNANPDSMAAAIRTFTKSYASPKILVLGDMGELGKDEKKYHNELGHIIATMDYDCLLTFGSLAKFIKPKNMRVRQHFETKNEIVSYIKDNIPKGANILLKASRSMKFEDIIEELKNI
ncbi:MAG: UDP-N-acetylmuramoyl-tripeptide--D-alanyl-D-alanine ligase [Candidatus Gastranaerophilales bacterium]|nr:UDP-N-acetylmuramoyl-tripeptide--D-alanyl-D-alanine ligase [Candidatus Gastranaerophilales bacterium]